jgi:repressor LexA
VSRALPPRQQSCYDAIRQFIFKEGYSPTLSEVARSMGVAKPTAQSHVGKLIQRGLLTRRDGRLRLASEPPPAQKGIRLRGSVAAGRAMSAGDDERLTVPGFGGDPDQHFAVDVKGDSMVDAHICDGDTLIVEVTAHVKNGEIVVAEIGPNREATVKVFKRNRWGRVTLEARNPAYPDIKLEPTDDFRIAGRVVAVLRAL